MAITRLLNFYGSKYRTSKKGIYPEPIYDTIVEPFAGSAAYSCIYYDRNIILLEKDEKIYSVLKYLINASYNDIIKLPLLQPGQSIKELYTEDYAEKYLIGFWLKYAISSPVLSMSPHMKEKFYKNSLEVWSERKRRVMAEDVEKINHWQIIHGEYWQAPDIEATWFIDPPYQKQGNYYRYNKIDYKELWQWIKSRKGQVIVCEQKDNDWLPREGFIEFGYHGNRYTKQEIFFHFRQ